MKKVITVITHIIFIVFFIKNPIKAQDAKEAFKKVNEAYKSHTNISYAITYSYYLSHKDTKPYETMTGIYKKLNNNSYSRIETKEVLTNDRYRVIIDNETKHLIVEPITKEISNEEFFVNMDTALSICTKITSKKQTENDVFSLFFNADEQSYSQIDITINSKTNLITKLVIYFTERNDDGTIKSTPRLEIVITDYNTNPVLSKSFFSEEKYVKIIANGEVSLQKKFNSYKLLTTKVTTH